MAGAMGWRGRRCRGSVSRSLKTRSAAAMAAWRMLYLSREVLDGAEEALGVLDEGDEDAEGDGAEEAGCSA